MKTFKEHILHSKLDEYLTKLKRNSNNIPRHQMPQITREHQPAFKDYLSSNNVTMRKKTVASKDLKFAQSEFNIEKIKSMLDSGTETDVGTIFVSVDDYVLDGNHRVICKQLMKQDVNVLQLDCSLDGFLSLAKDFEHTEYRD